MDNFVQTKSVVPTHDLYNVSPKMFIDMKYQDVLALKIKSARLVIKNVLNQHHMVRDSQKMNKALSALKFNEELLNEMGISLDEDNICEHPAINNSTGECIQCGLNVE